MPDTTKGAGAAELPRIEGFEVLRVLGEGGFGMVVQARSRALGRLVALKVLKRERTEPGVRERFLREAKLLVGAREEGLIPILDADLGSEPPWIALPWMAGGDLLRRIEEGGPAPAAEVLAVGNRLAAALAALHRRGIVHRDLKPANVLLDEHGGAWLADLGLGRGEGDATLTRTGHLVGTPRYLAPEVLAGGLQTAVSDVFALGVVLVELATGRTIPGMAAIGGAVHQAVERVEPRELRRALQGLVRFLPEDRPADGTAALAALAEASAEAHGTIGGTTSGWVAPARPEASGATLPRLALPPGPHPARPWLLGAGLLALAGLALGRLGGGPAGGPGGETDRVGPLPWLDPRFETQFSTALAGIPASSRASLRDPVAWPDLVRRIPGGAEFQALLAGGGPGPVGLERGLALRLQALDAALRAQGLPPVFGAAAEVWPASGRATLVEPPNYGFFVPREASGWLAAAVGIGAGMDDLQARLAASIEALSRGEVPAGFPPGLGDVASTLGPALGMLKASRTNSTLAVLRALWPRPELRRDLARIVPELGAAYARFSYAVGQSVRHEAPTRDLAVQWFYEWSEASYRVGAYSPLAFQDVDSALGGAPGSAAGHCLAGVLLALQLEVRGQGNDDLSELADRMVGELSQGLEDIRPADPRSASRAEVAFYLLARKGVGRLAPEALASLWRARIAPCIPAHPKLLGLTASNVMAAAMDGSAATRALAPLARELLAYAGTPGAPPLPPAARASLEAIAAGAS